MPEFPFRDLRPGRQRSAAEQNRMTDAVERLSKAGGDGGIEVAYGETGVVIANTRPEGLWIQLGTSSGAAYAWTELVAKPGGGWLTGLRQGTTALLPAYEVNGVTGLPAGMIVWAWPSSAGDSYLFECPVDVAGGPAVSLLSNVCDSFNAPVVGELPQGVANGSNTVFTLAFTPLANGEAVYVNGSRKERNVDYTLAAATITFAAAPANGASVQVDYWHASALGASALNVVSGVVAQMQDFQLPAGTSAAAAPICIPDPQGCCPASGSLSGSASGSDSGSGCDPNATIGIVDACGNVTLPKNFVLQCLQSPPQFGRGPCSCPSPGMQVQLVYNPADSTVTQLHYEGYWPACAGLGGAPCFVTVTATADGNGCWLWEAVSTGYDAGPCCEFRQPGQVTSYSPYTVRFGSFALMTQGCASGAGSGGGGNNPAITLLGTCSSATATNQLVCSLPGTVPVGGILIVGVAVVGTTSGWSDQPANVTFGGASLGSSGPVALVDGALSIWVYGADAPLSGSLVVTLPPGQSWPLEITAFYVTGEPDAATAVAFAHGSASTPDSGSFTTHFSPHLPALLLPFVLTKDPSGAPSWTGGFTDTGQSVNISVSGHQWVLNLADQIVNADGAFDAQLGGVTAAEWVMIVIGVD